MASRMASMATADFGAEEEQNAAEALENFGKECKDTVKMHEQHYVYQITRVPRDSDDEGACGASGGQNNNFSRRRGGSDVGNPNQTNNFAAGSDEHGRNLTTEESSSNSHGNPDQPPGCLNLKLQHIVGVEPDYVGNQQERDFNDLAGQLARGEDVPGMEGLDKPEKLTVRGCDLEQYGKNLKRLRRHSEEFRAKA
jgi:hypothetical protein